MKTLLKVTQITTDPTPYKIYGLSLQPVTLLLLEIETGDHEVSKPETPDDLPVEIMDLPTFFDMLNTLGVSCEVAYASMKRSSQTILHKQDYL